MDGRDVARPVAHLQGSPFTNNDLLRNRQSCNAPVAALHEGLFSQ
jgi:hypothetical protein